MKGIWQIFGRDFLFTDEEYHIQVGDDSRV